MDSHFKEIAIIGISPRNPYYSDKENIEFALDRVVREFRSAFVFIPGMLDRHNYVAYEYSEDKAKEKACAVSDVLKASVVEVCRRMNLNYADASDASAQVRIIDWAGEIEDNSDYQKSLKHILQLYEGNQAFHEDVRGASQSNIESRMANNNATKKRVERKGMAAAIECAAPYILGELAFLDAVPEIYGTQGISYFYHRPWPVFEKYIAGDYGCKRPHLKFCTLNRECT